MITPKYKLGDSVWFLDANKSVDMTIYGIAILDDYSGDKRIMYGFVFMKHKKSRYAEDLMWIEEKRVFVSKEKLLASL